MPLRPGRSRAVIAANIRTLIREGRPVRQAQAIAYRQAGLERRPRRHRPARRRSGT